MPEKKYKLAIVATHIIQYAVPLYHKINSHPSIELTVYFCSDQGLGSKRDDKYGLKIKWDNIDLDGLKYKFLKNYSPFPNPSKIYGLINSGIFKELRINQYDAVLINGYYTVSSWLTLIASRLTKTPLILTGEFPSPQRGGFFRMIRFPVRGLVFPWVLNFASAILYIGKRSKEFYFSYKKKVRGLEDKLFFAPYSVDNDFLFERAKICRQKREEIKRKLNLPPDHPVVLYLSQLIRRKQPLLLLKAFSRMKTKAILAYVGSGPCSGRLLDYISRFAVERVFLFGFKNYSQIAEYYSIADVFVLPSQGESYGLVINEAMCCGLPIITTEDVASSSDLVRNGENGYLIKAEDEKALTNALDSLLSEPERVRRMGEKSREIIKEWNYDRDLKGLLEALNFIRK